MTKYKKQEEEREPRLLLRKLTQKQYSNSLIRQSRDTESNTKLVHWFLSSLTNPRSKMILIYLKKKHQIKLWKNSTERLKMKNRLCWTNLKKIDLTFFQYISIYVNLLLITTRNHLWLLSGCDFGNKLLLLLQFEI